MRIEDLLFVAIPILAGGLLLSAPFWLAYAWFVRKRHPLLLPRLVATGVAMLLNVPLVFLCLAILELGFLPFAPGDGAIGDALVYIFGGYGTSLAGLIVYHIYAVLFKHWPKTARNLFITSTAAVLLAILSLMIVAGQKAGGFFLYWFVVFQMGFWVMRQADTIAQRDREQQAVTS